MRFFLMIRHCNRVNQNVDDVLRIKDANLNKNVDDVLRIKDAHLKQKVD